LNFFIVLKQTAQNFEERVEQIMFKHSEQLTALTQVMQNQTMMIQNLMQYQNFKWNDCGKMNEIVPQEINSNEEYKVSVKGTSREPSSDSKNSDVEPGSKYKLDSIYSW